MIERRRHSRMDVHLPVKVCCAATGRYLGGATCNISSSGALLRLDHPSLLVAGQRLHVGIAQHRRQALLSQNDFSDATVVRSFGLDGSQTVAVQFDEPQALAASA